MLLMPLLGGRWNFLSVPAPIRLIEKREMLVALNDYIFWETSFGNSENVDDRRLRWPLLLEEVWDIETIFHFVYTHL